MPLKRSPSVSNHRAMVTRARAPDDGAERLGFIGQVR
jgi:hypothetical protein